MLQLFISLLALNLPHQIPTWNLKLLYHSLDSELTTCAKTRLQKSLLPLQFLHRFILDLRWGGVRPREGWHVGRRNRHFNSQPQCNFMGQSAQVFKSSVPQWAKITSGKKACQRSGALVSVLLCTKNWLGNPVPIIYTHLVHFLIYKATKDHAPFQLLEAKHLVNNESGHILHTKASLTSFLYTCYWNSPSLQGNLCSTQLFKCSSGTTKLPEWELHVIWFFQQILGLLWKGTVLHQV